MGPPQNSTGMPLWLDSDKQIVAARLGVAFKLSVKSPILGRHVRLGQQVVIAYEKKPRTLVRAGAVGVQAISGNSLDFFNS